MFTHSNIVVAAWTLSVLTISASGKPDPREGRLLNPDNAPESGHFFDSRRLALKLDFSTWGDNGSWKGVESGLIYDLSIFPAHRTHGEEITPSAQLSLDSDKPHENHSIHTADEEDDPHPIIRWTPSPHPPFSPPGDQLGWTPYTEHIVLDTAPEFPLSSYTSNTSRYASSWLPSYGVIDRVKVPNEHNWTLHRVMYMAGKVFENGPGERPNNISLAAVYSLRNDGAHEILENGARRMQKGEWDFVWWELVPLTWASGDPAKHDEDAEKYFHQPTVPEGLERRLKVLGTRGRRVSGEQLAFQKAMIGRWRALRFILIFGVVVPGTFGTILAASLRRRRMQRSENERDGYYDGIEEKTLLEHGGDEGKIFLP
ncbi:hypothetical protein K402DRAFT_464764 [Aulographum hederae CBS 113979]|uniref:Uncharacterized protein n=1 Tax=Aulographum hederae CBS 113979 TaxID=1176131 RepID=A0A6G1GVZ2_9PEZI|nr:hypothetical protein K402DRAFT_464764 [Aulographum hederae CBS 113979]